MNRIGSRTARARQRIDRRRGIRPAAETLETRDLLTVAIAELPLPPGPGPGGSQPVDIVAGPDGNLWVTSTARTILRVTTSGVITEFAVPGTGTLGDLAAGPDGNVWFLDNHTVGDPPASPGGPAATVKVGKIAPDGTVAEFPLSSDLTASGYALTLGPDGNLWAALSTEIDRITPAGAVSGFAQPALGIVSASDGNLWFLASEQTVGKITPGGVVSILPGRLTGYAASAQRMVAAPDGNIYLATSVSLAGPQGGHLETVTPAGDIIDSPFSDNFTVSLTVGPGGVLWWIESAKPYRPGAGTPIRGQYAPPTETANPGVIVLGSDGNLWFTEPNVNRIGQVDLDAPDPGTLTAQGVPSLSAGQGSTASIAVATFIPQDASDVPGDYVARIDWGDGTAPVYGTIAADGNGGMTVTGSHAYSARGTFTISVKITDVQLGNPGSTATVGSSIAVAGAILTPRPLGITVLAGQQGSPLVVAQATSLSLSGTYTAIIDWGDGFSTPGELAADFGTQAPLQYGSPLVLPSNGGPGTLSVRGSHTYSVGGTYTVRAHIRDENGLTTTVVSTVNFVTPRIVSTHGISLSSRPGVSTGTVEVASFGLSAAGDFSSQFTATIDWGDGSAPSVGTLAATGPAEYSVRAAHAYSQPGPFGFVVTIQGPGQTFDVPGVARVVGPAVTVRGRLDRASDTGLSNQDGISSVVRPRFTGTTIPGATVQVLARQGSGTPREIGRAVANAGGSWSIVSSRLPEGEYTITASATAPDGRRVAGVPVSTGRAGGRLVVDTTGPRIARVALNPRTGQFVVGFTDNRSPVNPTGLLATGAVRFSRVVPGGVLGLSPRVTAIRPGGGSVTFSLGRPLPSGRYVLLIGAGSLRDAAGNALDGEFRGGFPTGDRRPGGAFQALFVTRGVGSSPALPIVRSNLA